MSNCKKCDKEILEGVLCEDCKKNKNKNIGTIAIILIIAVAIILIGYWYFSQNSKKIGNTMGNIQGYGYAVEGSDWIFYSIPDEKAEYMNIYKMKKDGSESTLICDKDWNVSSLNLVGNWLYFIAYEQSSDEQSTESKIYKMKTDGSDMQLITEDVTVNSYVITVIENEIYYINDEYQVCKISVNGGDSSLVSEDKNGFLAIYDGWIYYPDYSTEDYIICKMKLDGSEKQQITGEVMYDLNVVNDTIYFVNKDGNFCKVSANGGDITVISEVSIYNANISKEYVYYMRYDNPEAQDYIVGLYRMKLDGSEEQKLKTFSNYSSFINVVGDWVMYSDNDNDNGYMGMAKIDGSEDKNLYTLKFADIEEQNPEDTEEQVGNPTEVDNDTNEMDNENPEDSDIVE